MLTLTTRTTPRSAATRLDDRHGPADPTPTPDLARSPAAFLAEHERCDELATGTEDLPAGGYRVWVTCGCGARIARRYERDPAAPN